MLARDGSGRVTLSTQNMVFAYDLLSIHVAHGGSEADNEYNKNRQRHLDRNYALSSGVDCIFCNSYLQCYHVAKLRRDVTRSETRDLISLVERLVYLWINQVANRYRCRATPL